MIRTSSAAVRPAPRDWLWKTATKTLRASLPHSGLIVLNLNLPSTWLNSTETFKPL